MVESKMVDQKIITKKNILPTMEDWQDPNTDPYVEITNLNKSFGTRKVLKDINLKIYKNEFFSILGPSGCGKTTLMRILAGFESADSGNIKIGGQDVKDLPPYMRPVNMMFQSYALFPHMNVIDNIAFGLNQEKHLNKVEIKRRVEQMLSLVNLEDHAYHRPHELSGGQSQRVALARCLVKKPKLLLLDEPLAALDKILREKTQFEIVNIQEEVGVTCVMVTHDQEEAMTMSSRLAIMSDGDLQQTGTPHEIYEYPATNYVAKFFGNVNIFPGMVSLNTKEHDKEIIIESSLLKVKVVAPNSSNIAPGSNVGVAIRPEKVRVSKTKPQQPYNWVRGAIEEIAYLGDVSIYYVKIETNKIVLATIANVDKSSQVDITWEDQVYLYWDVQNSILLNA